ncbi:SdrD B-like domain-containing protein [Bifidobacterium sp. SO1]|uniref:SdrD B-like domain-containing protein n=1 Tax=Bifidobacterium sp. SO1 TaxID=2809029 RepID=UPI001BDDB8A5|nr:SdrD B-like domain-containing protein [Bifidobacterium sp. SO1]MBT1162997.1 carboxypeptidase regulatory-like domain-containing protein [Bifidobacterium sp. SO1]
MFSSDLIRNKYERSGIIPGPETDPTAVPVEPVSTTDADGDVVRTYNLPYTVQPGGRVIYHFTGTVKRKDADQMIHNQAWFSSPDTPYAVTDATGRVTAGVPHAISANKATPGKPDDTKLDTSSHDITGLAECATGSDYDKPEKEHWFSTRNEDQCDQVGAVIPAYTTKPVLGSISGLYWLDRNKDGIRQDGETEHIEGQQVVLEDRDGNQLQTTTTDRNGAYSFTGLKLGTYRIRFSRVLLRPFTTPDVNDTTSQTDGSSTDSDANITDDDYGMGTPTITLTTAAPDKEHVDAGVTPQELAKTLPMTGGVGLILLAASMIILIVTKRLISKSPRHRASK